MKLAAAGSDLLGDIANAGLREKFSILVWHYLNFPAKRKMSKLIPLSNLYIWSQRRQLVSLAQRLKTGGNS